MVDKELTVHGSLSYLEIPATDAARSASFYKSVLGWNISGVPDQPKFSNQSKSLIGRWVTGRPPAREPGLVPYIYVDDVRGATDRVAASGGQVVKPPSIEGDVIVATVRDPAGNLIGLWQEHVA